MFNVIEKTIDLGDGRSITVETGKMARQADGAVKVQMGNTILLATVVSAKEAREDVDFMPLSVEYKEKYASVGRFPGGFLKRETRPSDYEILIARLVDRALRPLFPEDYHADTFVTINLISADPEIYPDALAGFAASAALAVSDIPFAGPISEARVARVDGQFVINPAKSQIEEADIDIIVGATMENIMMVEGEMNEVAEEDMLEAIKYAHEAIKDQCRVQLELMKETGNMTKREYSHEQNDEDLRKKVFEATYDKALEVAKSSNNDKHARMEAFAKIVDDFIATLPEEDEVDTGLIKKYYHDVEKEVVRKVILESGQRLDGRKTNEIRPIACEVDVLPGPHGSALFTRGETQSLTTVTLGTKLDEQMRDGVMITGSDKVVLHYNFPPFSTGDARPVRGVSRREIGHGNLALRALKPMVPIDPEVNPYAVRIVSDILESNGSSSMATVCAGTMALMDCGIKLKKPVSGIAMGLITDQESGKYAVLSDILGDEDHLGDMDFKVTGTRDGVTACQMDIKVDGLSYEVMKEALQQANEGRLHILDKMAEAISEPRQELKPHTPRIHTMTIPKDTIGAVIGSGGKVIQELQEVTDTTITITEEGDLGIVEVFGDNVEKINNAVQRIENIIKEPEVGEVYTGKVVSIVAFGAFVEILPGKDGLLHVSELDWKRIEKTEDVLKEGDEVEVKVIRIENGKVKLSRRALLPKPEGYVEPERKERGDRRGDRRGGGGDRRRGNDRRGGGGGGRR